MIDQRFDKNCHDKKLIKLRENEIFISYFSIKKYVRHNQIKIT